MFGIAAVIFSDGEGPVGEVLLEMLEALQHRGRDSAGMAIYSRKPDSRVNFRVCVERGSELKLLQILRETVTELELTEKVTEGNDLVIGFGFLGDPEEAIRAVSAVGKVICASKYVNIVKTLGPTSKLDELYNVTEAYGAHGAGHVRFSTESGVTSPTPTLS